MRGHEDYKEMIAAHALNALEEAEARELETHLATCAECRAEFDAWQDVSAALVYAAPPAQPSSELRSRILENVRAEGAKTATRAPFKDDGKVKGGSLESSPKETNVVPFEKPARRTWSAISMAGALAASLAFIALIIALVLLWNRNTRMEREVARVTEQLEEAQSELRTQREIIAREREARDLISAPEARIMTLSGTEMATRARAKFVYDRTTGRAMLMADDLPPAPAGKAYQLWFIAEGKPPMPGQVFNTDTAGHAEMRDQLPVEARGATTFAVTLEPSNGVPAPTGPMYLKGTAS